MQTGESAVDRLSQASQRTASDVERIAALMNALQARVGSLESQVEATGSARTAAADRLEQVAASLQRLDRLERSLGEIRAEMTSISSEGARKLESALKDLRDQRQREHEQVVRAFDDLGERLARVEAARSRDDTSARIESVARDLTKLGQRVQQVDDRASRLEQAPPRTDPALLARFESFDGELQGLRKSFDDWQRKIEEQSEIVRRARAVADSMRGQVDEISRAHHATAEAQRIAEARTEEALKDIQAASAERWERFETARRHDWDSLAKGNAERDAAAGDRDAKLAILSEAVDSLSTLLEEEVADIRQAAVDRHSRIVKAVELMREVSVGMVEEVESGLPTEERSSVEEERKAARRRAFRARRTSAAD